MVNSSEKKVSFVRKIDNYRAFIMLIMMFTFMALFAPNFLSANNIATILRGSTLNTIVAIGFTIIFIIRQLDLSIGAVVMFSGMLTIGLQPDIGWTGSIVVAIFAGATIGVVNGLLVVKARIDSFIVTLGTMTIVTGLMHFYSDGGSKSVNDYAISDWLIQSLFTVSTNGGGIFDSLLVMVSPIVLIMLALVGGTSFFLNKTVVGRGFFLVGGNAETAWLAGLSRDWYQLAGFVICGTTAAIGGVLFSISLNSMTSAEALGTTTLMTVLSAVIIGGTIMTGGKGGVVKSFLAVLMLNTLFNGIGCFGLGFEVQIFINGVILAVVVLCEAYVIYRQHLMKGQRPDLLNEVQSIKIYDETLTEDDQMNSKERFAYTCITITAIAGITGIVSIFGMYFLRINDAVNGHGVVTAAQTDVADSEPVDVFALTGTDNQPLVLQNRDQKIVPPRPEDPQALPQTDKGHWWDIEYAGWKTEKEEMPVSPGDGPEGKKVILLKAGDHPYWTSYVNGFKQIGEAYKMDLKIYNSDWNIDLQSQQTDQAINEKPDMIILSPVDATAATSLLRRIHKSGIPCITSNTLPTDEGMKYCISWTGPDDWGQMRMLARHFADAMDKKGNYAIVRHMPGSSPYFARTYAVYTELLEYAPQMKMLEMDTSNMKAEGTMSLVSAWISLHGDKLNGLMLAGDGFVLTGALGSIKSSGREDIKIIAAGNCKTGMDSLKEGEVMAITYQSAEGDGAIVLHTAARWFKGETIAPVQYLPKQIITKENVDKFMPAQW